MKSAAILALALTLAMPAAALADEGDARRMAGGLGDSVSLGDEMLVVPLAVLEDTRCPVEVDCLHAGRFVLRVELRQRTGHGTASRTRGEYNLSLASPMQVHGGRLTLTKVDPPRSIHTPNIQEYRFTFSFQSGRR